MNEDKPARNDNPAAALAALLPQPVPVEGTGEVVRPFSLALYAALDRIHSPLLYGGSVNPENGTALLTQPDINGLFTTRTAFQVEKFAALIKEGIAATAG